MGLLPDTLNCRLRMRRECRERFPRHRLPRHRFPRHYFGGKKVPGIPGACTILNFTYLTKGPWLYNTNEEYSSHIVVFNVECHNKNLILVVIKWPLHCRHKAWARPLWYVRFVGHELIPVNTIPVWHNLQTDDCECNEPYANIISNLLRAKMANTHTDNALLYLLHGGCCEGERKAAKYRIQISPLIQHHSVDDHTPDCVVISWSMKRNGYR